MRLRMVFAAALLGAGLLAPFAIEAPRAQAAQPPAGTASVIVKYRTTAATANALTPVDKQARLAVLGKRLGIGLADGAAVADRSHVVHASGVSSADLAARLSAQPEVEYAVPDRAVRRHAVPNDPLYGSVPYDNPAAPAHGGPLVGQWYLKPPGPVGTAAGTALSSINAEQAWDITTGSANVVVAVLDTGIRFDHPDLVPVSAGGNVLAGYDMVSADPDGRFLQANDGNGRDADASDPGDFVSEADKGQPVFADCGVENSSWHGTQTASLVAARTHNAVGMASVARDVRLLPVRVIGKCGGKLSDTLAGMRWAAGLHVAGVPDNTNPARVINLSLGSPGACDAATRDAVNEVVAAGAVVTASAGNEGMAVDSPANCSGVIGVAGVRSDGDKGGISSLGPEVAISAPSANCPAPASPCRYPILAAWNTGTTGPQTNTWTDSFVVFQGTSFSAPLVAGAAALMLSVQPSLTPAEVRARLQGSARPFPTSGSALSTAQCVAPSTTAQAQCYCTTSTCGAGLLDVRAAVLAAAGPQARISVVTSPPQPGQTVTLSGADSRAGSGHSIVSYQWTLVDGGGIVSGFLGADNGVTVAVLPTAAGSFTVKLTTTDEQGAVTSTTLTVTVGAPVVAPSESTAGSSSGGGGGALGIGWLALLLMAVIALAWPTSTRTARRSRISAAGRGARRR